MDSPSGAMRNIDEVVKRRRSPAEVPADLQGLLTADEIDYSHRVLAPEGHELTDRTDRA